MVQQQHKVDFIESAKIVANAIGFPLDLPERKPETQKPKRVSKFDFPMHDLDSFPARFEDVARHRPEISLEDYRRAGGKLAAPKWGQSDLSIVIPQFDNAGERSGFVEYRSDGSKRNVTGTTCGIVGEDAIQNLLSKRRVEKIFKCAGVSDYLTMAGLIAQAGKVENCYCFTNGGGEGQRPSTFEVLLRPAIEGQTIIVIADNDVAGEKAAKKWANHFASYNDYSIQTTDVRILRFPKEYKDLRSYIASGKTLDDVLQLAEQAKPFKAQKEESKQSPTTDPVAVEERIELLSSKIGIDILDELLGHVDEVFTPEFIMNTPKSIWHVKVISHLLHVAKRQGLGLCQHNMIPHIFNGQYWQPIDKGRFRFFLRLVGMKQEVPYDTASDFKFADKLVQQFAETGGLVQSKVSKLNVKNGTLYFLPTSIDFKASFDRNDGLTYQVPYDYNPEATSPMFNKYIRRVLPDGEVQLLLMQYIGYVFLKHLKLQKQLFLLGEGETGKSTFLEVIQKGLIGESQSQSFSLFDITTKETVRAKLGECLLNVCTDISGRLNIEEFKKYACREPMSARNLYQDPFTLYEYATSIFSMNNLPTDVEQSHAYFRRFMIVPFNVQIAEEEKDRKLAQKIIANEMSGVLNWVIEGMRSLLAAGDFTIPQVVHAQNETFKAESCSLTRYLKDASIIPDTVQNMPMRELYDGYADWCKKGRAFPIGDRKFKPQLINLGFTVKEVGRSKTLSVFCKEELVSEF